VDVNLIGGTVLALVGAGFLVAAAVLALRSRAFMQRATKAVGTVVDLVAEASEDENGNPTTTFYPRVRFRTSGGVDIEFRPQVALEAEFAKGQKVEVLYEPADPKAARIRSVMELWFQPLLIGAMALIPVIIGVVMAVRAL